MKRYSFALAALALLVTPFAASAYSYMPASSYYPTNSNSRSGSMYSLQQSAQALSLQNQRYYIGTDCTDYGYGDCSERLARSGSQYGPGRMIMNPQQSYGGGYSGYGYGQYQPQYQPSYYGGYGYGNSYPSYYGGGYGSNYGGYNPYGSYNPYGGYYGY